MEKERSLLFFCFHICLVEIMLEVQFCDWRCFLILFVMQMKCITFPSAKVGTIKNTSQNFTSKDGGDEWVSIIVNEQKKIIKCIIL